MKQVIGLEEAVEHIKNKDEKIDSKQNGDTNE